MNNSNAIYKYLFENLQIEMLIKFFVLYFFIVWIAIIVWVVRDITNRTDSVFLQIFAIFTVLFLTPLGVFIYLLIRPSKTLFEKYYEEVENNLDCLSEEVKQKVGKQNFEKISCPKCSQKVEKEFKYCPNCNTKLTKKCKSCKKDLELDWKNCPYCGGKEVKKKKIKKKC